MDKTSLILTAIMTLALVLLFAPSVIAMNRGKLLRNFALWLAIFAGLALFYKNFGPDSPHPLFVQPAGLQFNRYGRTGNAPSSSQSPPNEDAQPAWNMPSKKGGAKGSDSKDDDTSTGDQGYVPPKEE